MQIQTLGPEAIDEVLDVLVDAFAQYPVMRYTLGEQAPTPNRLRSLIGLFVGRRFACSDPVFGLRDDGGELMAVAVTTAADAKPMPPAFQAARARAWAELGAETRSRYEAFADACNRFDLVGRHHYLNMLGVRHAHQSRGLAGRLLDHLHAQVEADPDSLGMALSTEHAANLSLYQRYGYRVLGHAQVSPQLETWALFRPRRDSLAISAA